MITHSLRRLLGEAQTVRPDLAELDDAARLLDQYYVSTRCPNGLDEETAPAKYYDRTDAERCLQSARSILGRVTPSFES